MKAYQCSKCSLLDIDFTYPGRMLCLAGIDPRPKHREKGGAAKCKTEYKELPINEWIRPPFSWE